MFYAIDNEGNRVHIKESVKDKEYFCPCCQNKLIRKMGSVVTHHFAHIAGVCDSWYSENKGPWHVMMQDCFPRDNQEIKIKGENEKYHIADILLRGNYKDTIVEFQHSPMSKDVFEERTEFYAHNGGEEKYGGWFFGYREIENRVVWVFDCRDKKINVTFFAEDLDLNKLSYFFNEKDKVIFDLSVCVKWDYAPKTFLGFKENKNLRPEIYLCVNPNQFALTELGKKEFNLTDDTVLNKDNLYFIKVNRYSKDFKYLNGNIFNFNSFIEYLNNIDEIDTKNKGFKGYYPYNKEVLDSRCDEFFFNQEVELMEMQ